MSDKLISETTMSIRKAIKLLSESNGGRFDSDNLEEWDEGWADSTIHLLEGLRNLTPEDKEWFRWMIDFNLAEYTPMWEGTCPGRERKDRFRAILKAMEGT